MTNPSAAHVALCAHVSSQVIRCPPPSAPSSLPPLPQFVSSVVSRSRAAAACVVVAVAYLEKVQRKLPVSARGLPCSGHRLFLAALILAFKYTNDKTYKNRSWVAFTENLFPTSEINLMERQFLAIVDFDLAFTNEEYCLVTDQIAAYEARINALLGATKPHPMSVPSQPLTPTLSSSYSSAYEPSSPPEYYNRKLYPSFAQGFIPSPSSTASPASLAGSYGSSYGSAPRFQPYSMNSQFGKRPVTPMTFPASSL
ncbi:UNVERIFIED_CONTAM: hypothetical protein HDU68_004885 [Siphonaria sp. JEL0065]|nr:hypothetical protein HDU68_004885 [Siphonaria sp. JEL0065]